VDVSTAYFDFNATTPLLPEVGEVMVEAFEKTFRRDPRIAR
jgi:cysteine sulfinate desulfinase/cysteine desulfurase-like protein